MHIRHSDVFSGLGHDFLKEIMIAARFFKHLAGALGSRLLQLYPRVSSPPERA